MAKVHYFQRYSSIENTVTNNTLQLSARIHDRSPAEASALLTERTGEPIDIGIENAQQRRAVNAVPDGTIIQRQAMRMQTRDRSGRRCAGARGRGIIPPPEAR